MSTAREEFWERKAGFEKMWRARRRRQYREKGKCPMRFPRLGVSSTDQKWLDTYRKKYRTITGKPLAKSEFITKAIEEGARVPRRDFGCLVAFA